MSEIEKELVDAFRAVLEWAGKDKAKLLRRKKMKPAQYWQWVNETLNQASSAIIKAEAQ